MDAIREGLLKVDPGLFLWTVITFLVLFLILWKAAWKPIIEALGARAEKVKGDIERAESNRIEAEKLLAQHKEMMDKAKDEANNIITESRSHAEKVKSDMIEKANEESKEIIEKAKREINLAKDKAIIDLKAEVVNLSTDIASKIITTNLKPEDQRDLVEEVLKNLESQKFVQ
ncbi:MAG: F0F1 ATP synthase subunit B [Spirochaetota bacterium]|nr:F0F1 ATP synthase subunit B [Spirochaetota bacterium]